MALMAFRLHHRAAGCARFVALRIATLALAWSSAAGLAVAASGPSELARVADAIGASERLEADMQALCDGIGARMAGTRGMRDALRWGREAFVEAGLADVRLEPVPMPLRWQEGETLVQVTAPSEVDLRAASSALSPAVPAAVEADLVLGGRGAPGEIAGKAELFRGKVLLVELDEAGSFEDLAVEQRDAMIAVREAAEAGALAVLFVSTRPRRLLYRHVNNVSGALDRVPSAVVARADGTHLARTLRAGADVRVRLRMPNRIGPAYETANVVGEIRGEEMPEEIVLVGAHLDSWDMGSGCLDNAVNAALVVHVARSVAATGVRPRRSLRFVLFGGEELGLFGSRAYADRHREELGRHVAAIVHDMGNGPMVGYAVGGRRELVWDLEAISEGLETLAGLRHTEEAYFLSDNFTFVLEGVPSLFAVQDTTDFYPTYHSEADTLAAVALDETTRSAAAAAAAALAIADRPERFGRRLRPDEVRAWLRRSGMERQLRFLGVWDAWIPSTGATAGRDGAGERLIR